MRKGQLIVLALLLMSILPMSMAAQTKCDCCTDKTVVCLLDRAKRLLAGAEDDFLTNEIRAEAAKSYARLRDRSSAVEIAQTIESDLQRMKTLSTVAVSLCEAGALHDALGVAQAIVREDKLL
jgi:hypothetical protein